MYPPVGFYRGRASRKTLELQECFRRKVTNIVTLIQIYRAERTLLWFREYWPQ